MEKLLSTILSLNIIFSDEHVYNLTQNARYVWCVVYSFIVEFCRISTFLDFQEGVQRTKTEIKIFVVVVAANNTNNKIIV